MRRIEVGIGQILEGLLIIVRNLGLILCVIAFKLFITCRIKPTFLTMAYKPCTIFFCINFSSSPPLCSAIWCYFCYLNMSSLSLPQDLCTYFSLCGVYFPQIFPWLATSHHSTFSLKIMSLGKLSLAVLVS